MSVQQVAAGRGVVTVAVTLDSAAVAAVGGQSALAAQLQDADLVAAGWTVTGPAPGPGSSTVISAGHPYSSPAQFNALVGELAGSGPDAGRPFRLSYSEHRTFWRTDTSFAGTVDLTCGLNCFGDAALNSVLGSPVGVNPAPLISVSGENPDQVFTFSVAAHLAGSAVRTNAASQQDGTFQWTPRLGQSIQLFAATRTWNTGRIITFAVIAGVVLLVLVIGLAYLVWRRIRRRRRTRPGRTRGGLHRKSSGRTEETVAPRS